MLKESPEGVKAMCRVMEEERKKTREESKLEMMLYVMQQHGWDAEKTMEFLGIEKSERSLYAKSAKYALAQRTAYAAQAK